jgi:NTE family protein
MTIESLPTERYLRRYTPEPKPERKGIALCLSGGGYRAALFHLGALRRLNELGILSKVTTITSVSGGSILAAHLATAIPDWPAPGDHVDEWDERVAKPFKAFTDKNIRTRPILKRIAPWNWGRDDTAVRALATIYEKKLTNLKLRDLPERPKYVFCATDMSYGVNWIFTRDSVGDYQLGYLSPPPDWPVARAVAASSCFPPIFNPLPIGIDGKDLIDGKALGPTRDEIVKSVRLSDGGVYDNMALEPVWKDHATLLVSDGGATFDFGADKGLFWRLQRYTSIVSRQASGVRKRWLISNMQDKVLTGTYWGLGSKRESYKEEGGYSADLVEAVISPIRTDLDRFSDAEKAILENHGYMVADAAIAAHVADMVGPSPKPYAVPNERWIDEDLVRADLSASGKVKLPFGRR